MPGCADLPRATAFLQFTRLALLPDTEAWLMANQAELFHPKLKARLTLSEGLTQRDWRVHPALVQRAIGRAGSLCAQESSALDSTVVDPYPRLFG